MDLPPGTVLATRYQVVIAVGRGATGTVYRARDLLLGETVALKVLREDVAARRGETSRFRREARFARRVTHPGVCRIHEYVEDGAWRFFAMEFVEGSDLKLLLRRRGPLPPALALDVALQVARGLGAIHAAGLVHTDLTARNVLCDATHRVKLTDFGFARRLGLQSTPAGQVAGTPEYMSPEQARGEPVDQRSDLYSLGILLFEMLTGEPPFHGATPVITLSQQIHADPPLAGPRALRLPRPLLPVLAKALAKAPTDRYRAASDMQDALMAARREVIALDPAPVQWAGAGDEPPATSTETLRIVARAPLRSAATAVAALVLALGAWLLLDPRPTPPTAPPLAVVPSPQSPRPPDAGRPSARPPAATRRVGALLPASPTAAGDPATAETDVVRIADEVVVPSITPTPTPGEPAAAEAPIMPAPPDAPGRLQIGVKPWAVVTIDGRDIGETPIAPVALAPGVYTARFEHPAYRAVVRRVTVRSGETGASAWISTGTPSCGERPFSTEEPMTTLVLCLSLASAPQAQGPELVDAIRLVDEGDLDGAVAALETALARLAADNGPERDRALGHLYLGMALLGLDRPGAAQASVQEAWRLNRGARLDPRRFPPRVVRLYQEVGREARPPANGPKRAKVLVPAAVGVLIGAGAASLGGESPVPAAAPPQPPAQPVAVRLFNNDDAGRVFIGGTLVREVGLGEDTGPVDVSSRLTSGLNEIVFELVNAHGGISYGFEVRLGDAIVFQETCGIVYRAGCENDRKFPPGVIRRFTYLLQR